ncbi:hypothetical protein POM88_028194 [Heracleum sosnowskyi]|uniref:Uncharacterized protein n=1 Tax=Heracleum sosnowskyi TaxID=360622 RepID=A0AAD8MM35_9APIA|nr:hypothetical protein POM88_028194 [Heracleum sosnowskyi]
MKHKAYTPQMVSIGPFHQHKDELRAMEELKWIYMLAFVGRVVISDKDYTQVKEPGISESPAMLALYKCSKVILEVEEKARAWAGFQIARGYRSIVDIRFIGGILFIPQVFIDRSSDTIFRNLIALEQTSVGRYTVTSYVKLMNTLIRSPEDVIIYLSG